MVGFDRSLLQWRDAARATVILAAPIALGVATGYVAGGVFAAIGTLNILFLQFWGPVRVRLISSGWGVVLCSVAFAAGTAIGTLGWLEVPLVAIGLVALHATRRIPDTFNLGFVTAALFLIGVGLPSASFAEAAARGLYCFLGGAFALGAFVAHVEYYAARHRPFPREDLPFPPALMRGSFGEWTHAVAVGVSAAAALSIALALGLARDYWAMLTVVVVLRMRFDDTIVFTTSRFTGTVLGAGLGAALTLAALPLGIETAVLVALAFGLFLFQRANYLLYAVWLTAFVILLLDLVYPAGLEFAEVRVIDTVVGGVLGLAAAALLWYGWYRRMGMGGAERVFGPTTEPSVTATAVAASGSGSTRAPR